MLEIFIGRRAILDLARLEFYLVHRLNNDEHRCFVRS